MGKLNVVRDALLTSSCAIFLAACGGGSGTAGGSATPVSTTPDGGNTTTGGTSGATITLTNLPTKQTTSVSATIGYEVSAASSMYTVYCRLDAYAPILCPSQFSLGQASGLQPGVHTVDYYIDTGSGIDVAKPTSSYSWTVADASTPTTPTAPATPTAPTTPTTPSSATGLQALAQSAAQQILSGGGSISTAADSAGRTITTARITQGGTSIWGGVRAELAWRSEQTKLYPGHDYWMAFAVQLKSGESITGSDGDMLVFQTHTPAQGDTQPDIALYMDGSSNKMRWRAAYNTKPSNTWSYVGGSNPDTEAKPVMSTEALPSAGVWTRFVIHYRPGYSSSHSPRYRVWRANAGQDYVQLFDYTGFNTYNSLDGPSYPRIGPYKWTDSNWGTSSLAFYQTPLYFGEGADLLESAKASLSGL